MLTARSSQPSFNMRLSALAVLAPLVTLAAADSMVVWTVCTTESCSNISGTWYTAYGHYYINGSDGCRDPPDVPGMNNICIDWAHARAHFYFDNQPKRCLTLSTYGQDPSCSNSFSTCFEGVWNEVACTW